MFGKSWRIKHNQIVLFVFGIIDFVKSYNTPKDTTTEEVVEVEETLPKEDIYTLRIKHADPINMEHAGAKEFPRTIITVKDTENTNNN